MDIEKHKLGFTTGLCEKVLGYSSDQMNEIAGNRMRPIILPGDYEKLERYIEENRKYMSVFIRPQRTA